MRATRFISILICLSLLLSSVAMLASCEDEEYVKRKKKDSDTSESSSETKSIWPWSPTIGTEGSETELCTDPPLIDPPIETEYWSDIGCCTEPVWEETAKEVYTYIEESPFTEAHMGFAVDLFKKSVNQRESDAPILVSPLSVTIALAMTANGAAGETREDMEATLGGLTVDELNESVRNFVRSLPDGKKYRLLTANSIWMKNDGKLEINDEFLDNVYSFYSAKPYLEPFDESTVENINYWISDNTDKMIDELISEIDPTEVMYLINAICFDAEWAEIYEDYQISEGFFTNLYGDEKVVRMMSSVEGRYLEDENTIGFIKPYAGGYSFAALLPKDGMNIYDYINDLDPTALHSLLTGPEYIDVYAKLPQFSYEFDTDMRGILTSMGMGSAFAGNDPDFSKMGTHQDGDLAISRVLHKTFIDVTQYGTRASAVTSVVMTPECESMPGPTKNVVLDRPFVYMIIDNNTRLPIFMGAVTDIDGKIVGYNNYKVPTSKDYVRIDGCGDLQDMFSSVIENPEGDHPYIRIDSVSELEALTSHLATENMYFMLDNTEGSCSYNQLAEKYGDEYFEQNSMIMA